MGKTIFLIALSCFIFCNATGQIKFEKGYFIDNLGNRTDCLIKNEGWKNNPKTFEYRININDDTKTGTLHLIKEFSIPDQFKYVKFTVEIDRTMERLNLGELSYDSRPDYKTEELFLKVIVEGKATLYLYDANNLRKFFYSMKNEVPTQLVYKRYKKSESALATNNEYKQTLFLNLNCYDTTMKDEAKLKYSLFNLVSYFEKYNSCENANFQTLVKREKVQFNLNIKPRINFSSLNVINNINDIRSADFGSKTNFSAGIEAEFILNFNKGSWSIFIEPAFFNFNEDKEIMFQEASIKYSFIELALGFRHYFFIDQKSKIFANVAYVRYLDLGSKMEFEIPTSASLEIHTRDKMGLGAGYNFDGKFSLEYRIYIGKKDFFNSGIYSSDFNYSSLILGYTLF